MTKPATPIARADLTEKEIRRFRSYFDAGDPADCWEWQGLRPGGYGCLVIRGKTLRAHRVAYALAHGSTPTDLVIDHLCRNPPCVNPAHLEAVTQPENVRRGVHRPRKACPEGHEYTTENVYIEDRPDHYQRRICRTCKLSRLKRWREQNAAHRAAYERSQHDKRLARSREPDVVEARKAKYHARKAAAKPEEWAAYNAKKREQYARRQARLKAGH